MPTSNGRPRCALKIAPQGFTTAPPRASSISSRCRTAAAVHTSLNEGAGACDAVHGSDGAPGGVITPRGNTCCRRPPDGSLNGCGGDLCRRRSEALQPCVLASRSIGWLHTPTAPRPVHPLRRRVGVAGKRELTARLVPPLCAAI